jgi:hypothetical protein
LAICSLTYFKSVKIFIASEDEAAIQYPGMFTVLSTNNFWPSIIDTLLLRRFPVHFFDNACRVICANNGVSQYLMPACG